MGINKNIPFFIPKAEKVKVEPPYTVVVWYETDEIYSLNMEKYIREHDEYTALLDNPDLFKTVEVGLDGYSLEWNIDGKIITFHTDNVFLYGKCLVGYMDLILYETVRIVSIIAKTDKSRSKEWRDKRKGQNGWLEIREDVRKRQCFAKFERFNGEGFKTSQGKYTADKKQIVFETENNIYTFDVISS